MDQDETQSLVTTLGLSQLAAERPGEIERALDNARSLAERIPRDLHWSDEPAHVFNANLFTANLFAAKAQQEPHS
ncbi:MAG: hypothetical protein ACR2PG_01265 [Hyphomicrobiaceae bacterium]